MNPPIKIKIKDKGKYADVASLVDQDEFLKRLLQVRREWKLKDLMTYDISGYWDADRIWGDVTKEQLQKYHEAVSPIDEILQNPNTTAKLSLQERIDLFYKHKKMDRMLPGNAFRQDVQEIRKKFHKPPNFDRIIAHAILYGEVRDQDYHTCTIEIDYPEVEYVDYDREARPVIVFYPHLRPGDIHKLLKQELKQAIDQYQKEVLGGKLVTYDAKTNIERDRVWYWMWQEEKKKGKGAYNRIADKWNDQYKQLDDIEDINIIEQAVSRYRLFLKR